MGDELTKEAAEMLLKGATLLSEPCPYCSGVRVMKDGNAFCVNCGRKPEDRVVQNEEKKETPSTISTLEKKLETLSKELEEETDHKKQQDILQSINSLIEIIDKLKKQ